jgi:hypothetical protein
MGLGRRSWADVIIGSQFHLVANCEAHSMALPSLKVCYNGLYTVCGRSYELMTMEFAISSENIAKGAQLW